MSATEVPERYQPDPRPHESKERLYELYWGQLLSQSEIATELDVGKHAIQEQLCEFGIPRRVTEYTRDNAVSPYTGFYRGTPKPARTDERSGTGYDPDWEPEFASGDGEGIWGVVDATGDRR